LSVPRGAIAEGFGSDFFGPSAQAPANVFPWQAKRPSFVVNAANRDVNVGMLGVVMDGSDPFELCAQVAFHPLHQFASALLEVQAVGKLRRHDNFEEPLVSGTLPIVECAYDA
jgi:hypothetical protein